MADGGCEDSRKDKPYHRLLTEARHRPSSVEGRSLEEEADADRGRILFSAPFRRLQNKAQVFSLETNAAVRSRLTHSLEVSSIGRYVAEQAISAFTSRELENLGIAGSERSFMTFVEVACLIHDIGNPPFGHFGEIAISHWFHGVNESRLRREDLSSLGGSPLRLWEEHYRDFRHFDGNPQGFRIITRLQAPQTGDLNGLNLTATTLAATLKYPWSSALVGTNYHKDRDDVRKKAGFFRTEEDVVVWLRRELGLVNEARHPLVFLMEAADDIAYCMSDIEDGIEKGMIVERQFADYMSNALAKSKLKVKPVDDKEEKDVEHILTALERLKDRKFEHEGKDVERLTPMQDFRSGVIRFLARRAGLAFKQFQKQILIGNATPLLRNGDEALLLRALRDFTETNLYSSSTVRNREITAHAVLSGLLDAYLPMMSCKRERFLNALAGERKDSDGTPIARDSSLVNRIAKKYLAVYHEAVRRSEEKYGDTEISVMERIHRMRLVVDNITGMTDEFALQSYQLISGVEINPHRD